MQFPLPSDEEKNTASSYVLEGEEEKSMSKTSSRRSCIWGLAIAAMVVAAICAYAALGPKKQVGQNSLSLDQPTWGENKNIDDECGEEDAQCEEDSECCEDLVCVDGVSCEPWCMRMGGPCGRQGFYEDGLLPWLRVHR